jgi:hypothetical protein
MFDRKRIKLLCAAFFVLGASLTLALWTAAHLFIRHYHGTPIQARTVDTTKKPWGILEPIEIPLANSEGILPDQEQRLQDPKWLFEQYTEERLTRFLRSLPLSTLERRMLLDKEGWRIASNGVAIYPPEQVLWSLDKKPRQTIYAELARSPANYPQCFPFRFTFDGFESKLAQSGLAHREIARLKRLTYTNAGYLCFTDLELVRRSFKTADFKKLIETLYVIPTYFLRVRVTAEHDLDAVINYWGKGGREKRIAPIIKSIAKLPGGGSVNISYLMPTFARLHLYTYPESWNDPTIGRQDCFFTAMNFFNDVPDTNFFSETYSRNALDSEYEVINEPPQFGDMVTLFDSSGQAIHTCVYLADDFVFTKNGVNLSQPWVVMRLPDMLLIYYRPGQTTGRLAFLRRKHLAR